MSKVLVIGGSGFVSRELIKALGDKFEGVVQGEPLIEGQIPRVSKGMILTNENEWRGGSRGKGGKTKWPIRK